MRLAKPQKPGAQRGNNTRPWADGLERLLIFPAPLRRLWTSPLEARGGD